MMLEHREHCQATLERIDKGLGELTVRQPQTHATVLRLRRDQVNDAEVSAHLQVQLDSVRSRIDRIERRLELSS